MNLSDTALFRFLKSFLCHFYVKPQGLAEIVEERRSSTQVIRSFWPWWDSESPLLLCVDFCCEQLRVYAHVKCRLTQERWKLEMETGHFFWPWQALQHKYYNFAKSQLPPTQIKIAFCILLLDRTKKCYTNIFVYGTDTSWFHPFGQLNRATFCTHIYLN